MGSPVDEPYVEPIANTDLVPKSSEVPNAEKRIAGLEDLTRQVYLVVIVSVGAMIVALVIGVSALILDQLHFNNELYRNNGYNHIKTIQTTNTQVLEPVTFPNLKP